MTRHVGIDPGKTGAVGVLWEDGTQSVYDLNGSHADTVATLREVLDNAPLDTLVTIERVHSMPKQGVASSFTFGEGYGVIIGAVLAFEVRHQFASPTVWKKRFGLTADKDQARDEARRRFPALNEDLRRKKDNGRAEALLLAEYGAGGQLGGAFVRPL